MDSEANPLGSEELSDLLIFVTSQLHPPHPEMSPAPLTSRPRLQSLFLLLLSTFSFTLLTIIAILSSLISPWLHIPKHIKHYRRWRSLSSATFRPRTILVTDLHTPEALALARIFYRAGHRVIGADYEPYYVPIPSRISASIEVFY